MDFVWLALRVYIRRVCESGFSCWLLSVISGHTHLVYVLLILCFLGVWLNCAVALLSAPQFVFNFNRVHQFTFVFTLTAAESHSECTSSSDFNRFGRSCLLLIAQCTVNLCYNCLVTNLHPRLTEFIKFERLVLAWYSGAEANLHLISADFTWYFRSVCKSNFLTWSRVVLCTVELSPRYTLRCLFLNWTSDLN